MKPISAWAAGLQLQFRSAELLAEFTLQQYKLKISVADNSLWITAEWPSGGIIAFMAAFSVNDKLKINNVKNENPFIVELEGETVSIKVSFCTPDTENPVFTYRTTLKPKTDLLIPYWPKDIMPLYKQGYTQNTSGTVHAAQAGTRSGVLFFSMEQPNTGSVFYFQDLTSLNNYCETTQTSAGGVVGGAWPEIGMSLPATQPGHPLNANEEYIISDTYVLLSDEIPEDNFQISRMFLNYLAQIYLILPKPETEYFNWHEALGKSLTDLEFHKGCWQYANGHTYLNAYVSDYKTPPESMVQLAVLLPLKDYDKWSGENHSPVINTLHDGLETFYDEHLKTIVRWLPAKEQNLDWEEEQKKPDVMDSWYLHHPLLNLSRLALDGDEKAKKLLMDSAEYAIKVAHHFNYEWPVFYKMATLEVIKAETEPGHGGEKDVPGTYAHLMLQLWQLTKEKRYLNEAVRAAKKLSQYGMDVFYQANNTAFTAGAMVQLYKITKDELYLNISYLCIAAMLRNVQLWECNYGNAKHYPKFFSIYPLKEAPYTAAYEDQEVYAAVHSFLKEVNGIEILPSVKLLLAEFIKYTINRVSYYYPPRLPLEVLAKKEEIKSGEIDASLWIALEDLRDGWERSGQVGQEVYGAGIAFGIVPRQYCKVEKGGFMIFTEYPLVNFKIRNKTVIFSAGGDNRFSFRMVILPLKENKLTNINVNMDNMQLKPDKSTKIIAEYTLKGNCTATIKW
jgi:hypothetical protein